VNGATRYGTRPAELPPLVDALGEAPYRARQLGDVLWRRRRPLEEATNLPKALRAQVADALPLALDLHTERTAADGMTTKWLWQARRDGVAVETVLMRSASRATVCVSSQAGCAMGCTFCATGQGGFERHLDVGEIVEQVVRAAHVSPQPVTNVVFMGMGEPLANYDETWSAVERLHDDLGISARRIVVSTVGVVPGMRRLARERLPVTLAVSLHATTDATRDELVPLNRRYPIAEVLDAAAQYAAARGRRVTFEYACIAGVNDTPRHGHELGRLLGSFPGPGGAHVNLIPLNPTAGFGGAPPPRARVQELAAVLRSHRVAATVRRNRGTDIDAACGQLRGVMVAPAPASDRMVP
jgi:23S rRNA (adenine2503-C2)-methyltransferase